MSVSFGMTKFVLAWLAALGTAAAAQLPEWTWTPEIGYGQHSPVSHRSGTTPDWTHLLLTLNGEAPVASMGVVDLAYAPVLMPFAMLHHPTIPAAYAIGAAPLGIKITAHTSRFAPYVAGAIGGLWASRPIPVPRAAARNIMAEGGAGIDIRTGGLVVRAGYRFLHISNMYTAAENPGLDGHIVYVGWRH